MKYDNAIPSSWVHSQTQHGVPLILFNPYSPSLWGHLPNQSSFKNSIHHFFDFVFVPWRADGRTSTEAQKLVFQDFR